MADVVIRNGKIIDGAGNPWFHGDVAVSGGTITAVGEARESASKVIDAEGLCVCPGFIDMHSHPDLTLFYKDVEDYKLRQGVTTEVGATADSPPRPSATPPATTCNATPPSSLRPRASRGSGAPSANT